jgi:hypothetical protein
MRASDAADRMGFTTRGRTSVMNKRNEGDGLDDFPTPPWATRALCEFLIDLDGRTVWEPACGRGIMADVLVEYAERVYYSDVHDYGRGFPVGDFLSGTFMWQRLGWMHSRPDWIITNPPFRLALDFALRAIAEARIGAALLVRTNWLEGGDRYERLFKDNPPTIVAPFAERVSMTKGRWDPDENGATSYSWFVWHKAYPGQSASIEWIPPGSREALTKPDDRERFSSPRGPAVPA